MTDNTDPNVEGGDVPGEEVARFVAGLIDKLFSLNAERIRFEVDGEDLYIRFYAKKDRLETVQLKTQAFETIWTWLQSEPFKTYHPTVIDPPYFEVIVPYHGRKISFCVQRSKTLRQKTSLLLWNFVPVEMEQESETKSEEEKEIEVGDDFYEEGIGVEPGANRRLSAAALDTVSSGVRHEAAEGETVEGQPDPEYSPLVLIVEDQPDQRRLLSLSLKALRYRTREAANGQEALDFISECIPDVIITDLMMPKMDGSTFIGKLKEDPVLRKIPVMVFTVISDPSVEYDILDLGVDEYCEKTAGRKVLLERLQTLLGGKGVVGHGR